MSAGRPAFGLSFDPRALTDLLGAPDEVRDTALSHLRDVVNAERRGLRLTGDLEGYRKLFVDPHKEWRLVYGLRPAPETSAYRQEVHVVAVRPRARNDVYDTVGIRLGMSRRPLSARAHAARVRSPQLTDPLPLRPGPAAAMSGPPRPATVVPNGPLR
ncbi:hypothetical protein [Streptomyces sp. ST2-7A]|uniref:hypothetical protein n=1 Tax=Streptomyces sp. ST2-7A TaxID=2907214 RepID=UPI001F3EBD48|nr:hypothetical protein [Streptomyces sp. ST2-7A]MCE7081704.1 hypothetical protein [Streptomyces sp. ST2-7A]